jgi:hypothetical protein
MASMKTAFICPSGLAVLFVAEAWEFDAFCADRWFFWRSTDLVPAGEFDPVP